MIRFRLTEDGFRERFRTARPKNNETCSQYLTRLRNVFERWVELSGAGNSCEALFELLLKEQFLSACATTLQLVLKDRRLANRHGGEGHSTETYRVSNSNKGDTRKSCQVRGKPGHPTWKCWKRGTPNLSAPPKESATSCIEDGFLELKDGVNAVPVVNAGLTEMSTKAGERLPVVTGLVGGKEVRVLRDTSCRTVIVKTSLVKEEDCTATEAPVYLLDRSVRILPEAFGQPATSVCSSVEVSCRRRHHSADFEEFGRYHKNGTRSAQLPASERVKVLENLVGEKEAA
ncbi:hypothetical protein HPB50_001311 [Hyalomma asiaticum]|uniref:Uncharacterized protein n=1 Tax=Hyalomma asiaticum TaxID=266040 RepID=A0ACB7SB02_HYAAI|nr:hypothetical protein HPB50_001311 [Hyalomma asiaticum]